MMVHCNTVQHPLQNSGTQQIDRLMAELVPENLQLDDRSIEEVVAFAGSLAKHVRYWNAANEADGDWLAFWESDQTTLFAILAGLDTESIRIGYRSKELDYAAWKKQEENDASNAKHSSLEAINALVSDEQFGIYAVAMMIASICEKMPATHPLKTEIQNIISTTLREPLKQLIRFHKAVDPEAIRKYSMFIGKNDCAATWGLPDNAAFECLDFVVPYESIDVLWKLFLVFYRTLTLILGRVKKAFQASLRSRQDHAPHITLFITFLYLFRYLQDDLNSLTGKHLLFYYQDVLRLQRKRLLPDKVHLVFEIASKLSSHRIVKGTAFKAGADAAGKPMSYELEEELIISAAQLVEKKNLYLTTRPEEGSNPRLFAVALPAADRRDGIEEEWGPAAKAWHPLSGVAVFERFFYKYERLKAFVDRFERKALAPIVLKEMEKGEKAMVKLQAFSGFSIASTSLWSTTGLIRMITVNFDFDGGVQSLLERYTVQLSTASGLISLKPYFREIPNTDIDPLSGLPKELNDILGNRSHHEFPTDIHLPSHNFITRIEGTHTYVIILDKVFPSVLPLGDDRPPFIRFIHNNQFTTAAEPLVSVTIQAFFFGRLSAFKTTQGVFFRNTAGGVQSVDEIVISSQEPQEVIVRIPELFIRKAALVSFDLMDPFKFLEASLLVNDQWIKLEEDGTVPPVSFPEPVTTAAVPARFEIASGAHNADGWGKIEFQLGTSSNPNDPQVFRSDQISILYHSASVHIILADQPLSWHHVFSYYTSLGEWVPDGTSQSAMRATPVVEQPQPDPPITIANLEKYDKSIQNPPPLSLANGNLFLGFSNLVPNQTLPLLFQTAPGTENPDHYAPEIVWSYLRNDMWVGIPPQYILRDSTLGLKQTGIILFQIPGDINNGNTWIKGAEERTDLYWLRASAQELPDEQVYVDALPMLKDIFVNAGEAVFAEDNDAEDHLDKGIPAGTISDFRFRDVAVKSVSQPFHSFDGRRSEKADLSSYLRRVHERLRHRNRAVSFWDYERITLQRFPKIAVVKCLPHTRKLNTAHPGHVTLAAIPFPKDMTGNRVYYPICSAGLLQQIKTFLAKQNSYFVGRYGDPEFCCCEDDCACEHQGRLDVINARFEPVRLKICVRFYEGHDIPFYTKELNEALKRFLAPWAKEAKPLLFGVKVSITRLLRFLENLVYVDVVMGLQVKHFSSRAVSENFEGNVDWSSPEEIMPFTAASVLTTYLDKLNEDNPNVIDHEINVIHSHEKCTCKGCTENAPAPVDDPNEALITRLRENLRELWLQHSGNINSVIKNFVRMLDDLVEDKTLKGDSIADPEKGEEGTNAYRIKKEKRGSRIRALEVGLSFNTAEPFILFNVNNPNSNV